MNRPSSRRLAVAGLGAVASLGLVVAATTTGSASSVQQHTSNVPDRSNQTASPIKHLVVIFDENVSYDHYFGTYPKAANTDGTRFYPGTSTPKNDNLVTSGTAQSNPNLYRPRRLTPSQAVTCDQNHSYGPEQKAADGGLMDKFVEYVSRDTCTGMYGAPGLTMDYYDGNTVTGLWNYAQQYAMSDNFYGSSYGPSTPGALNLVSGQTHGFIEVDPRTGEQVRTPGSYTLASPDANGVGTVINDPDPAFDDCSDSDHTSSNTLAAGLGRNVGDLLNDRGVSWGWFQGGFRPTKGAKGDSTYAECGAKHTNVAGASVVDYSPHHNPFAYYRSTANPHHLRPKSVEEIGHAGQANHNYDLRDFDTALKHRSLPAVSFLKAPESQDGHAGYSDPVDEQHFLVRQINELQKSPDWKSTAVVVAYDDSDGWYDHKYAAPTNGSHDASNDSPACDSASVKVAKGYDDRCGPGPRLPLLVISPYAKTNFVDHRATEQASVTRLVEDNWFLPRLGDGSFDARGASLSNMFDFTQSNNKRVVLRSNGAVGSITPIQRGRAVRATEVRTR